MRETEIGGLMRRRDFFKTAGLGAAAAGVTAPAIAQSMPETKWRLTSGFPRSLDLLFGGAEVFCKAVAEATDNKFRIEPSPAGEIAAGARALDAAGEGTVEMAQTASYYSVDKDPTFAFGTAVPFGLNGRMQNAWFTSGGGELLNAFYAKHKVVAFAAGNTGCQMGGWFRKELTQPSDLSGLKFRIGGLAAQMLAKLGVVPQQVAGPDLASALEQGTIDAAAWVGPYDDDKAGLLKGADTYHYPAWWEGGALILNFVNLDRWNALTPTYRAVLRTACASTNVWMQSKYDAANPAALKRLVGGGARLKQFPDEVMDACYKAASDVYAETSAKNADFKKICDHMMAFRGDQYLWWQLAEYGFDTYMIKARSRA